MLIRLYWSQCTLKRLETEPIDTFWLEATKHEAENLVFPYCSGDLIAKSQAYGIRDREIALRFSNPSRPYCFLIAQDLTTIEPFAVHYPYSPMWQSHSPFKEIVERHITTLEELKSLIPSMHHPKTITNKKEKNLSLLV